MAWSVSDISKIHPVTDKKAGLTCLAVKPTYYSICQSVVVQVNNCCPIYLGEHVAIGVVRELGRNKHGIACEIWHLCKIYIVMEFIYQIYLFTCVMFGNIQPLHRKYQGLQA